MVNYSLFATSKLWQKSYKIICGQRKLVEIYELQIDAIKLQ